MHLTIGWLYAASMNIYGDRGNVIALKRRAEWRGISTTVREINIVDPIQGEIDCF
jgi:CobQ-like glutamine amidotransferase family enzyme